MLLPHVCSLFLQPKLYKSVIDDVINEVRELFLDEGVDEQVLLELKTVNLCFYSCEYSWGNVCTDTSLFSWEGSKPLNEHLRMCCNPPPPFFNLYPFYFFFSSPSYFSYGKTNYCSQRQWRASILRSRRPCRLPSNSSSRSNQFSRWSSQRRPSRSSCLRSHNSKVSQHWQSHCGTQDVEYLLF